MRKKSSKHIQLILITSVLASCGQPAAGPAETQGKVQRVYMRADSTAVYTDVTSNYHDNGQQRSGSSGMGSALLWFMAFRHLGGGMGYANNNLHPSSVSGTNAKKSAAVQAQRGGFGKSAVSSSSSSYGS